MGPPYNYDRVLFDSDRYLKATPEGKFSAWWETYLRDEGFENTYCHFGGLFALRECAGTVVRMLGMDIPHLRSGHIVAVDEWGVIDPADNAPDHVPLMEYLSNRRQDGVVFHTERLAVKRSTTAYATIT